MPNSTNDNDMAKALAELSKQTKPNVSSIADKYKVNRTTLSRHFNGTQRSRSEFLSESRQCLNNAQERVVIDWINQYTERSIPPTSQLVHNVAEEVCGRPINKNWVAMFHARHRTELHADYIRTIDSSRVKSENIPLITKFYDQVSTP
jgi:hypothetical protein